MPSGSLTVTRSEGRESKPFSGPEFYGTQGIVASSVPSPPD